MQPEGEPVDVPRIERTLHDIHFRLIEPGDQRRLQRFHDRLSQQTVALRFHGAKKHLSTPLAHRFTHLDGQNNVAWVATTGTRGRIIGVARYFRTGPSCAEVAFVVEDRYQHHRVGHRLMERLVRTAGENGITQFIAEVVPGNVAMLQLLEEAGTVQTRIENGVCEVLIALHARSAAVGGRQRSPESV